MVDFLFKLQAVSFAKDFNVIRSSIPNSDGENTNQEQEAQVVGIKKDGWIRNGKYSVNHLKDHKTNFYQD